MAKWYVFGIETGRLSKSEAKKLLAEQLPEFEKAGKITVVKPGKRTMQDNKKLDKKT